MRHRLLWVVDDDNEEEETASALVRKPRSRPDVAPVDGGWVAEDPSTTHVEQAGPGKTEAAAAAGRAKRKDFTVLHRSSNL